MDSSGLILDKYFASLEEFRVKYISVPGVIMIDDDHWDGSMIVVYVNNKFYHQGSVPDVYDSYHVMIVDVYTERNSYQDILLNIRSAHPDIKDEDDIVQFFQKRINTIQELIDKYEASII